MRLGGEGFTPVIGQRALPESPVFPSIPSTVDRRADSQARQHSVGIDSRVMTASIHIIVSWGIERERARGYIRCHVVRDILISHSADH